MTAMHLISDPNIAYVLFLFGLLALTAELYHPGAFVPGLIGLVSLVLAVFAFGSLPISGAGIVLILLAIGLFAGELHTGTGALALAAVTSLIVGSLFLYGLPGAAGGGVVRVSLWVVAVMSTLASLFFLVVVRATLRARRLSVRTGVGALIGEPGIAETDLAPSGRVRIDGEVWSAETDGGTIHEGERVKIIGAAGVTLHVTRWSPAQLPVGPYRRPLGEEEHHGIGHHG
jgi:membrane-bound serine protease (ClpP class)